MKMNSLSYFHVILKLFFKWNTQGLLTLIFIIYSFFLNIFMWKKFCNLITIIFNKYVMENLSFIHVIVIQKFCSFIKIYSLLFSITYSCLCTNVRMCIHLSFQRSKMCQTGDFVPRMRAVLTHFCASWSRQEHFYSKRRTANNCAK